MSTQHTSSKQDFRWRAKNDAPIARLIGFEVMEIGDGRATIGLAAGPQHANPMGTLHGGILCDIADAAMGIAFGSTIAPEESFTTVELKINFFRPVWQAQLTAEGTVVRRGRTIGYVECSITDFGEPIGGEGGVYLHGAPRSESHRAVTPDKEGSRIRRIGLRTQGRVCGSLFTTQPSCK